MMTDYEVLRKQVSGLLTEEPYYVAAMSNISSVLKDALPDINWAGFYILRSGRLVVGPFQGKPACIHIGIGSGVCGCCVRQDQTIVVPDVHAFPGHIACDSASNSEIVIPIHCGGRVAAVLDIDSPLLDRFSEEDRTGLENIVSLMEKMLEW